MGGAPFRRRAEVSVTVTLVVVLLDVVLLDVVLLEVELLDVVLLDVVLLVVELVVEVPWHFLQRGFSSKDVSRSLRAVGSQCNAGPHGTTPHMYP